MELRDLLYLPELGLELVLGRDQLDRAIRWVIPTDLPDPRRYLSGGELVLTGMLWRQSEADSQQFVGYLAAAGVSALGVGDPERGDIPAELIEACRQHNLPLFHVNPDVGFSTITERVVQRLSANRSADLAAVLGRHRQLIASGGGLGELLALVQAELGMDCQVLSASGRLIRASGEAKSPDAAGRATIATQVLTGGMLPRRVFVDKQRAFSVFGVGNRPHRGWSLVIDDDHTQWPPQRRDVAEELVALVDVELQHVIRRNRAETDLIEALVSGADLTTALTHAGMTGDSSFLVAVCTATGTDAADMARGVFAEAMEPATSRLSLAAHRDELIAIAQVADHGPVLAHAREVAKMLSKGLNGHRVSIGISATASSVAALSGALSQARHAAGLAAARGNRIDVAGPDDLTSHVMLLANIPPEIRHAFRSKVLGPVVDYDREHNTKLVETLRQFLENEGSWSRCAAKLHLHVNTLRYRIERVEQLTGRDLRRMSDRVDMFLALRSS